MSTTHGNIGDCCKWLILGFTDYKRISNGHFSWPIVRTLKKSGTPYDVLDHDQKQQLQHPV